MNGIKNKLKIDLAEYKQFLMEIGYLVPEGENFSTTNVDKEISEICAPS